MSMPVRFAFLVAALFALSFTEGLAQPATPPPFPGWAAKMSTPAPTRADSADIVGEWEGYLTEGDGSNPGQRRMNLTLSITKDTITSEGAGGNGTGNYRVSAGSNKLRHIDATGTSGQYAGKQYEGIFSLEGNTLRWCSGNPGKGRPAALKTNAPAGHFLMVLTRK